LNSSVLELVGQQDRLGQLALADVRLQRREQPLVERFVEVSRLQPVAQPFIGGVVVQQRAQQRLFGLDVRRRHGERRVIMDGTEIKRGNESHGLRLTKSLGGRADRSVAPAIHL